MQGNWLDLALIAIIIFYLWDGWGRGFFLIFSDLIVWSLAALIALTLYRFPSVILQANFKFGPGLANGLSFIVITVIFQQFFSGKASLILSKIPSRSVPQLISSLFSLVPSIATAIVIITIIINTITALPLEWKQKSTISQSTIGELILTKSLVLEYQLLGFLNSNPPKTLTVNSITADASETVNLGFKQLGLQQDESNLLKLFEKINQQRVQTNKTPLQLNEVLTGFAISRAQAMFEAGQLGHTVPKGDDINIALTNNDYAFNQAAEIIIHAPTANLAYTILTFNHHHYSQIIADQYNQIGIGIQDGQEYGQIITIILID